MGGVFFFCVPFHIRLEKFRAGSWFFHLSRAIWGPPRAPGTKCGYDMGVRYGKCVFHRLSCSSAFETLQIKFYGLLRSEISIRAINFVARVPSYCNFECKAFSFRPDQPWVGALFENLNDAYRFYRFANQKTFFFLPDFVIQVGSLVYHRRPTNDIKLENRLHQDCTAIQPGPA